MVHGIIRVKIRARCAIWKIGAAMNVTSDTPSLHVEFVKEYQLMKSIAHEVLMKFAQLVKIMETYVGQMRQQTETGSVQ